MDNTVDGENASMEGQHACLGEMTHTHPKWPMFLGHIKLKHARPELAADKEEAFAPFAVSEKEYNRLTGKEPMDF